MKTKDFIISVFEREQRPLHLKELSQLTGKTRFSCYGIMHNNKDLFEKVSKGTYRYKKNEQDQETNSDGEVGTTAQT